MFTRLLTGICTAAVLFGLSAAPAFAVSSGSSRVVSFSLGACNGSGKILALNLSGFSPNSTQYIVGGALNLSVASGKVKFLILSSPFPNNARTLLIMSVGDTSARFALPNSSPYIVTSDASGNLPIAVQGACTGGGTVAGFATVYFE